MGASASASPSFNTLGSNLRQYHQRLAGLVRSFEIVSNEEIANDLQSIGVRYDSPQQARLQWFYIISSLQSNLSSFLLNPPTMRSSDFLSPNQDPPSRPIQNPLVDLLTTVGTNMYTQLLSTRHNHNGQPEERDPIVTTERVDPDEKIPPSSDDVLPSTNIPPPPDVIVEDVKDVEDEKEAKIPQQQDQQQPDITELFRQFMASPLAQMVAPERMARLVQAASVIRSALNPDATTTSTTRQD